MMLSLLALQINTATASWSVFKAGMNGKTPTQVRESLARVQELQKDRDPVATPEKQSVAAESPKEIDLKVDGYGSFTGTITNMNYEGARNRFKIDSPLCWDVSPEATEFSTQPKAAHQLADVFNMQLLYRHTKKPLAAGEVYNVRNRPVIKVSDVTSAIE